MARWGFGLMLALLVCSQSRHAQAGDPYLSWYTLTTPHFRVHYHSGLHDIAQRVGSLAENIQRTLVPELRWTPDEVTEVILTDDSAFANGSASVLPYNAVRLFVSAPEDMSVLGDYDHWLKMLLTHEHTHILHIDNLSGIPALINAIIGKSLAPNQLQPRWILEGLATAMESFHSTAGRLRSTQFDMYLRADVLEDNFARLDQISNPSLRWPNGNLFYLYGSKFVEFIRNLYGPDIFAAIAADYGNNLIPYGINRSIQRVTSRTYVELYAAFHADLKRRYSAQARSVRKRGLREGKRLTHHGRIAFYPRIAKGCAAPDGNSDENSADGLIYFKDDGHEVPGFYWLALKSATTVADSDPTIVTRAQAPIASFDGECGLIFESVAPTRRRYFFRDLFRQAPGTRSTRGFGSDRQRLTTGLRASSPSISPDGKRIVYVTNHKGTTTLKLATLDRDFRLRHPRTLVRSAQFEQAYTPRFSPDGRKVAYSAWTWGGFRDIRIVDLESGQIRNLMHDRAMDQQPVWSPDGKRLYFSSDRTGIANIYAYDFDEARLYQVTNVINGAYMPEPSADGRTLYYVGYSSAGFDLFALPIEQSRFLTALPPRPRPDAPEPNVARQWPVESYQPWPTLAPRNYEFELSKGVWGTTLNVTVRGNDIARLHSLIASASFPFGEFEPGFQLSYGYHRLPVDLTLSGFRSVVPRRGFRFNDQTPLLREKITGFSSGIFYAALGEYETHSISARHSLLNFEQRLPLGPERDPYALLPIFPHEGLLSMSSVGYRYTNAFGTHFGISRERGWFFQAFADLAAKQLGSEDSLTSFRLRTGAYLPMPWLRHHVLAVAASGGIAGGSYPRRGLFFTGGFNQPSPFEAFDPQALQSGFVLRGYEPAQFIGNQYQLFNAEYRFPISYFDRGVSTLPAFLRTISGTAFADYGGAFNHFDFDHPLSNYHLGVGGELWFNLVLGYFVHSSLRLGIAKGLDSEAPGLQTYFVAAAAF